MIHDLKNFNTEKYCDKINRRLLCLLPQVDPGTNIMNELNTIKDITLLHAPLRKLSRKEMKVKSKPWLIEGLFLIKINKK